MLGGESSYTLQRVVDFCDGWFPRGRNAERVLSGLAELKERAAKAGRDMKTITTSVFGAGARRRARSTSGRRPASPARSSACPPRAATRSCRCSTSGRS